MSCFKMIVVGARGSALSKVQLQEVLNELKVHHPHICFDPLYVQTMGDKDKKSSLRPLEKTNFFTKEIDELLLGGQCRVGIHSAKDLPDPLPKGLALVALTKGLDPSDALVLRENQSLKPNLLIATSSVRREKMARQICPKARFVDLRGTIHERLAKLQTQEVDGVVVAEAALIRLNLTHLNRIPLPGQTTAHQGRLAVVAREGDGEIRELFECLVNRINHHC